LANPHYGRIGDIWKHLPLAEILAIERPAEYWESHAGSARYPLAHSWQRDFGVFHFLSHAEESVALGASRYRKVLAECANFYPGSGEIAMRILGPGTKFVLCDIDAGSVESLRSSALELGIPQARCENGDGHDVLWDELGHLSKTRAQRLFVHLDPWSCLAPSESTGRTSLDMFRELSRKGAAVVLWVGFDSIAQRNTILERFDGGDWFGEMQLDLIKTPRPELNPGIFGCGLYCANLSAQAVQAMERLGSGLVSIYAAACIPPGESGRLRFQPAPWHRA
jgi:23S rRNA A2030 N6-methylase RlmJ